MNSTETYKNYMPQLDALRAFAVISVIFGHIEWGVEQLEVIGNYCRIFGVRLFFVLSGFLITRILLGDLASQAPGVSRKSILVRFYVRRALRIVPPYFFVLALGVAFQIAPFRELIWWCLTFSINLLFAFDPVWAGPVTPFWTLAIEEQFYLLWPFFVLFLSKPEFLELNMAFLIISPIFRVAAAYFDVGFSSSFLLPSIIDFFVAGGLLAVLEAQGGLPIEVRKFLTCNYFVILTLYSGSFFVAKGTSLQGCLEQSVFLPFLCLLIYKASRGIGGLIGAILASPVLVGVGKISYSMYLVHLSVIALTLPFLQAHQVNISAWGLFVLTIAISVVVSTFIWYLIERPIRIFRVNWSR